MKVSFLVTYYNQKEYVAQSLDSILRIEKPWDWEILVGDDGSNDGTAEAVKEYMDRYPGKISLYVMDREQGRKYETVRRSSANRLNLVSHMTGDFFCFLDGDDYYCHTDFVCHAMKIFAEQPAVSVVAFGYQMCSEDGRCLSSHTLPEGPLDTGTYLAQGMYTPAGACVFRNHMTQERKAFLNRVVYFDDNNIVTNNLHDGDMYAVDQVIYAYRQAENSTYNAMQFAERAVLNAQSFDVDTLLLPSQEAALLTRYSASLLQTWALGGQLKRLLPDGKWERYLTGCSQLDNSVTAVWLGAEAPEPQVKARCRRILGSIIKDHPKMALREFLRCCKQRLH